MKRLLLLVVLGVAGLMLTPAAASAQFGPPLRPLPSLAPLPTPFSLGSLSPIPRPFAFIPRVRVPIQGSGGLVIDTRRIAINNIVANYFASGAEGSMYGQFGSYMTGGTSVRPDLVQAAQREIMKAQREAALPGARDQISGQSNYEKGMGPAMPGAGPQDPVRKALAASNPAEVASGDALNELLKEIVRVEAKGAKGPSAYIPSLLLDDIRFAGSPAADLLNLARQAGSLPF